MCIYIDKYPKYLNILKSIQEQGTELFRHLLHFSTLFSLNTTTVPFHMMIFNPFRLVMGSTVY